MSKRGLWLRLLRNFHHSLLSMPQISIKSNAYDKYDNPFIKSESILLVDLQSIDKHFTESTSIQCDQFFDQRLLWSNLKDSIFRFSQQRFL